MDTIVEKKFKKQNINIPHSPPKGGSQSAMRNTENAVYYKIKTLTRSRKLEHGKRYVRDDKFMQILFRVPM